MAGTRVRTPKQERATRTRAALLDAARSEFEEHGYAGTTARSIAARAGMANGSFYQYFDDKDAVLREIWSVRSAQLQDELVRLFHRYTDRSTRDDPQRLRRCMAEIIEVVTELHRRAPGLHAVVTERAHADPKMGELVRSTTVRFIDNIANALKGWNYPGDHQARALMIHALVEGAVHVQVLDGPVVSHRRFARDLADALLDLLKLPAEADVRPLRSSGTASS